MKLTIGLFIVCGALAVGASAGSELLSIGNGWSKNSVNAVVFRHNSVVSDGKFQYVAYYDEDGHVVLAKRQLGSRNWQVRRTECKGNVKDAHNSISIIVDGDGYLHLSWDHHGSPLRYCRSRAPGSLELTDAMPMTGTKEDRVTYPEFYRMPDGNLVFLYRDGWSGNGSLVMNYYDVKTKTWTRRQDGFIDGEGQRNAYWQMCTDAKGNLHISWVWRESANVASNHDMGYAVSKDGGVTWHHELINTTSMCVDSAGNPCIATYYREEGSQVPQYHLIYHDGKKWKTSSIGRRKTPFSLSGGGSKRIPISRPRILVGSGDGADRIYMVFRDEERGNRVSVACCSDLSNPEWMIRDLTDFSVGQWEPSYDTELWRRDKVLNIYVQNVGQGDGEGIEDIPPQMVSILEWKP